MIDVLVVNAARGDKLFSRRTQFTIAREAGATPPFCGPRLWNFYHVAGDGRQRGERTAYTNGNERVTGQVVRCKCATAYTDDTTETAHAHHQRRTHSAQMHHRGTPLKRVAHRRIESVQACLPVCSADVRRRQERDASAHQAVIEPLQNLTDDILVGNGGKDQSANQMFLQRSRRNHRQLPRDAETIA